MINLYQFLTLGCQIFGGTVITLTRELGGMISSPGLGKVEQEKTWGNVNCLGEAVEELEETYDSSRVTVSWKN